MRHALAVWLAFSAPLAAPSLAHAATVYVDREIAADCATYDPAVRACGGGTARAFATIQGSFASLTPGDVVIIRGGTYTGENAYGPHVPSGAAGAPIVFRAMDGEAVHVQGDVDPHSSSGVGAPFRIYDAEHVEIAGLEISGFFQGVVVGGGDSVRSGPARHVVLHDLEVHDCGLGIYVIRGSSDVVIRDVVATANYLVGDGGAGVMIRDASDVRVERVIARDNDDGRGIDGDGDGFHVEPGTRVSFVDCVAENNSEDGYDLTGDEIRIERSVARASGAVGFKLWDEHAVDHPEVYRYVLVSSIALRNGEAGIFAANGPHVVLANVVSYANLAEGVRLTRGTDAYPEADAPTAEMVNCIVAGNGRWGRRFGDGGGTDHEGWDLTSDHNVFSGNGTDDPWPGEGEGTLASDPLFVDPDADDLHLLPGSPAVDSGRALEDASLAVDRDGVRRPMGGGWDIGAYELPTDAPDAGSFDPDASRADAALAADAGLAADGGRSLDAGPDAGSISGGCGCRASARSGLSPSAVAIACLAALAGLRRRARR